jgi:MoaD family protein
MRLIKARVEYFSRVREITRKREEMVEMDDNTTAETLLHILSKKYGQEFLQYVFDEHTGTPRVHLQLLVDGRSTMALEGNNTKITDGCVFAIIPPVGGG